MVFRSEPMFSVSATADWLGRFALFDAIYADATEIVINEDERRAVDLRRLTIVK